MLIQHRTVVVMPTIVDRQSVREITIDQWKSIGWDPIVVEQDPPYGGRISRANAHRALKAGLATSAKTIIFSEDDIDLDPRIPEALADCVRREPCSLWHARAFEPAHHREEGTIAVLPAINRKRWYSSMCFIASRDTVRKLLAAPLVGGIDMDMRNLPLTITLPSLVQHRNLPSAAIPKRRRHVTAPDYEGPTTC